VSSLLRVGRDGFEIAMLFKTRLPIADHLLLPVFKDSKGPKAAL
jgi:hypothetical protein